MLVLHDRFEGAHFGRLETRQTRCDAGDGMSRGLGEAVTALADTYLTRF